MADLELLALDTSVPQIRAPGAGDGYSAPRSITMASGTTFAAQAFTANPANANVSLAPTGTGTVTINPATAGTMNNVAIGGSTAAAGSFTSLNSSAASTFNGGVVINEPGADADTRIEGDTDANLFFADASTDRIGIGTSSPSYKFHVENNAASTTNLAVINTSASSGAYTQFRAQGDAGVGYFGYAGSGNAAAGLYDADCVYLAAETTASGLCIGTSGGSAPIRFFTNGSTAVAERVRIDSTGLVGIGTTNPSALYSGANNLVVGGGSGNTGMTIYSGTTGVGRLYYADGTSGADAYRGWFEYSHTANELSIATNAAERMRVSTVGVSIGGSAVRGTTAGTNALQIFNGTAPVGTLTNGISLYSAAGEAYVMDAAGNATLFSPHDSETNEWIFKSKHTPTGKVLRIDVEKLLRFVNDHFGLDAVQEFVE